MASNNRSPSTKQGRTSRRTFLKTAGVAGAVGGSITLAGCMGGGEGGDGGGGGEGGDGGGDGGSTGGGEQPTIRLTRFPGHTDGVIHDYMQNEGILDQHMSDAGFNYEIQDPVADISLFLSDKTIDQVNMGTLEAARLVAEQDVNLVCAGRINSIFYGTYVREGGELDPANSGSIEATWTRVAEEDRPVGIYSWGLGNIPGEQVFLQTQFGLDLSETGGDFSNVVVADPAAVPNLLVDGDIDVGMMAPSYSPPGPVANDEITPLYSLVGKFNDLGYGVPHLDGPVWRQATIEERPEAARAYNDALTEAMNWFYESGWENEVPSNEEYYENLNSPDSELAAWQCNWLTAWNTGNDVPGTDAPSQPTLYNGAHLTDDWISRNREYVNRAGEQGLISDSWSEDLWGDRIQYHQF